MENMSDVASSETVSRVKEPEGRISVASESHEIASIIAISRCFYHIKVIAMIRIFSQLNLSDDDVL